MMITRCSGRHDDVLYCKYVDLLKTEKGKQEMFSSASPNCKKPLSTSYLKDKMSLKGDLIISLSK